MKFILLVEGKTERDAAAAFLKRWLDPQLHQPVGIQTVPFDGYADLLRKMATKARMHLEGPKQSEIVGVIGLLDLYGPTFYPPDKSTADERFAWGKAHFEKEAARLAGVPRTVFLQELGDYGVATFRQTEAELREELNNA